MTLKADDFIRRLLLHVLCKGFLKILLSQRPKRPRFAKQLLLPHFTAIFVR